jgi:outer membrane protein assembly factor BamB
LEDIDPNMLSGRRMSCLRIPYRSLRVIYRAICTTSVLVLAIGHSVAEDWPQFRGPTGDGISKAKNVPLTWSSQEHVVWKQAIPGSGWSSPVLFRGKLYLTTASDLGPDQTSLRAICMNAADGAVDWNVELFKPDPAALQEHHVKNGVASPTPVVTSDRVYVHFGHLGTAALDPAGKILWRQTELSYLPRHGNGGSPVVAGNSIIFSCDARTDPFVAALDCDNGHVNWKVPRNTKAIKTFSFCTPTVIEVDGVTQVISPGSGFVAAYDPKDGREIWRVRYGEGYSVVPRPVFANGLLFVATGFERPSLLAIDPKGASGDVTDTHVRWTATKGAPLTPSVLAVGSELYLISDNGVATCLELSTGKVNWTKRLGGDFSASPFSAEGRIYFQNEAGTTYIIKAGTTYELLATNDLEDRTLASAVPDDGALYIRSEKNLWRIGN